jgi:hypothetical protein
VLTALQLAAASAEGPDALIGSLAALAALVLIGLGASAWYLKWVRIKINGGQVELWLPRGVRTRIERTELGGVALRDIRGPAGRSRPVFLIYDLEHRCRAAFDRRFWAQADVDTLATFLGSPNAKSRSTTNERLNSEFPGSLASWRQHGTLVAIAIVFVPIALIAILHSI